jgi:hypothetical protein
LPFLQMFVAYYVQSIYPFWLNPSQTSIQSIKQHQQYE